MSAHDLAWCRRCGQERRYGWDGEFGRCDTCGRVVAAQGGRRTGDEPLRRGESVTDYLRRVGVS